jgi:hypothetical protein
MCGSFLGNRRRQRTAAAFGGGGCKLKNAKHKQRPVLIKSCGEFRVKKKTMQEIFLISSREQPAEGGLFS